MPMRAIVAFLLLSIPFSSAAQTPLPVPAQFIRGDANGDGPRDVSDAVAVLGYLFLAGEEPSCLKTADVSDDGAVDVSDAVVLLSGLFLGGPRPAEPSEACGVDPTPDGVSCRAYPRCEFETVVSAYDLLTTVAGRGARADDVNEWEARFEGGRAVDAELSNPHMAQGDGAGNIYIADKEAHAIRKVSPQGTITTVAGTGVPGDDGDAPGPARERRLRNPNGLQVRGDGAFYILDTDNGKVRRVDPAGVMTTLIIVSVGISTGRGLWVSEDERLAYISSGDTLLRWTPDEGVVVHARGFASLGNLALDPAGNLVATDRGAHRVYRVDAGGAPTTIAGSGLTAGGGDGQPALETGIFGVRGIAFFPHGGYLLATHQGSQVWYVDTRGVIHLFLDGRPTHLHSGDGQHFHTPGFKISEARSVTLDPAGNVLIVENDFGYVRRIQRR